MTENSKMLERVRALLAKAEGTNFPEEADAFRAKADQLMTQYAIDAWMVDHAQDVMNKRPQPERRDFDRSWRSLKFRTDMFHMFSALAQHCRCVIGYRGASFEKLPVYGLPSDLDYLDMLYTSLALEVAKNMSPPVREDGDPGHEVFKQRQAGIGWEEITRKMFEAGLAKITAGDRKKVAAYHRLETMEEEVCWSDLQRSGVWTDVKNRLANLNRRYIKEHGLQDDRNYVKPEVYQRSFMAGFSDEIARRIYDMSRRSREAYDTAHEAGSMDLAVRDIRSQALSLYEEQFPAPPPVPIDPNAKPRRTKMPAVRTVVYDSGAMSAGRSKARDADLASRPGARVAPRKQIDG